MLSILSDMFQTATRTQNGSKRHSPVDHDWERRFTEPHRRQDPYRFNPNRDLW